jgi:hypothetical protein
MRVAYWNSQRFLIEEDPGIGWYLYIFSNGSCVKDYLQDSETLAMQVAAEDYDVSFRLWHDELFLTNKDQEQAFTKYLDSLKEQLKGKGVDHVLDIIEGIVNPTKRIAPLPELLDYIESCCHVRAWGDLAAGGLGYDWWAIIDKIRSWCIKLKQNCPR